MQKYNFALKYNKLFININRKYELFENYALRNNNLFGKIVKNNKNYYKVEDY
jgi:hypothetical protein